MKLLYDLDLDNNQLHNQVVEILSDLPEAPKTGRLIYHTLDNSVKYYNGTSWVSMSGSISDSLPLILVDTTALTLTETNNAFDKIINGEFGVIIAKLLIDGVTTYSQAIPCVTINNSMGYGIYTYLRVMEESILVNKVLTIVRVDSHYQVTYVDDPWASSGGSVPTALIDLTTNTVTDNSNAIQLASEGKPSLIYIKYESAMGTLYSLGTLTLTTSTDEGIIINYNRFSDTGVTSSYLIQLGKTSESAYEIQQEVPSVINTNWMLMGNNGSYSVNYPNGTNYADELNRIRLAMMMNSSVNLSVLFVGGTSGYVTITPSSIYLRNSDTLEVRTKAIDGVIEYNLVITLTESSATVTVDPSVYSCNLSGSSNSYTGTIVGNAWGKLVKLVMSNGAYSYVNLSNYSVDSTGQSLTSKIFTSIIFPDDIAYDCTVIFSGSTESISVSVTKPLTISGTVQATNFKEK